MGVDEPVRERLVDAGVQLLEQVGAAQLGLRAIAREAGVSHGAPRRYFPTHSSLLAAIAARGFADLSARFTAHDAASTRDRVDLLAHEYIDFAARRPQMFTLMFRHDLLEGSGENLRRVTLPIYQDWTALIAECVRDRDGERAFGLWTNLHGIATLVANRNVELIAPDTELDRLAARTVRLHLSGGPNDRTGPE
ncbi:TetR/AcrR family transcriptional regulator [Nocardia vermiculata]|uniref:TetR/AcrR family transcriptional regulator n=1 Tax=Nocardia vermiculata TaxID=257274 RepID=A0A846XQD1_9NOCA|nr:TetR/AcrR family transcriptional regulator [Nocardia vermiculata]NKY48827.1 TetR/AcrR family transcriptional regulator [Nocardia vermiculata]